MNSSATKPLVFCTKDAITFGDSDGIKVSLISWTNQPEELLLYAARVSSTDQNSGKGGLIRYLLAHKHVSPLEMPELIFSIDGFPRTIARQAVRHKASSWAVYDTEQSKTYHGLSESEKDTLIKHQSNASGTLQCEKVRIIEVEYPFFDVPGTTVQEHSYRYGHGDALSEANRTVTHARLQHPTDRQRSIPVSDVSTCLKYYPEHSEKSLLELDAAWIKHQLDQLTSSRSEYDSFIKKHISNEQVRNLLHEGLTPTKIIVKMNLRSFIHFQMARNPNFGTGNEAQAEIQYLADLMFKCAQKIVPTLCNSLLQTEMTEQPDSLSIKPMTRDQVMTAYDNGTLDYRYIYNPKPQSKHYKTVDNPFVSKEILEKYHKKLINQ